jgi:hypothetical protein
MNAKSKLLEKHNKYLKSMNKDGGEPQPIPNQQTSTPAINQNPFARQPANDNGMVYSNVVTQQSVQQQTQEIDIEKLRLYNCNPDCVRTTTEVFPLVANANSVVFPLGAFIKPLGLSVS